ncbi:hypothetical protein SUGI_0848190 [Cryptomeria japonica]|uniref:uncharacterized protein LOC131077303 n=1 Tax=Cryptomeria japonica TaxID=3369 RepID=UPI002414741E|nr:uncharacterized protein LOC131077303 [Cryptomeria japonica]GLJ40974.1 hypothetical protein SUGI_0848190 [Cryptomeria japonica]
MPTVIQFHGNSRICIISFKPHSPPADDLVATLVSYTNWFENSGYLNSSFILRSIHGNLVMWFGFWGNYELDSNQIEAMQAVHEILSKMAQITGHFYHSLYHGQSKTGLPFAKVSRGDFVTTRLVLTETEKQESLCYACVAILKSYFNKTKGLRSCTCFKSLDGDKVLALAVWNELSAAYAWILDSGPNSEKVISGYVAELIVSTTYDVMEVVYATGDEPLEMPAIAYFPVKV